MQQPSKNMARYIFLNNEIENLSTSPQFLAVCMFNNTVRQANLPWVLKETLKTANFHLNMSIKDTFLIQDRV